MRSLVFRRGLAGAAAMLAALTAATACQSRPQTAIDVLQPCTRAEDPADALCGSYEVYENRAAASGRRFSLKIVVWPALSNTPNPDPLVFLAGGPGQGAAKLARQAGPMFCALQQERDIVLVDQRGTGGSNPLDCPADEDTLSTLNEADEAGLARLRRCLSSYDADPQFYTTPIAMDDLDDVRGYLGYERINIYGASYGTRAGLVYLRRHGDRVRTLTLDGVAPTDMRLPLYFARDAQRALDRLLADCAADRDCGAKYPNLPERVDALFARLDREPRTMRLLHPRTGRAEDVRVDAALVAQLVFAALYTPQLAAMLPELLARADRDDYQALLTLATAMESKAGSISTGMQLSVTCSEDAPRISPEDVARVSAGSLFAGRLLTAQLKACEFWPRGTVPEDYYEPVRSSVPTLLLSGDVDPVTPPTWGEQVAGHLARAVHLVAPYTGHGVGGTGCGQRLIRDFVNRGGAEGLDASCLSRIERPPFFLSPAGGAATDPAAGGAPR